PGKAQWRSGGSGPGRFESRDADNGSGSAATSNLHLIAALPAGSAEKRREQALLGTLIRRWPLLDEFAETLGTLEFSDPELDHLRQEMTKKGINILSGTVIESIEKTDAGYAVHLQGGRTLATNLVMYATGRKPKTSGLGLEKADIRLDEKGAIIVNEWFQTSCPSVYALGDVTDRVNLTPVALAEGMALAHTLFNNNPTIMNYENIPSAVFSHPPIGSVGLSEEDAAKRGDIDVYVSRFKPMKHTLSGRDEQSLMKLIVERSTDKVIGLHMVGPDSPEIAQGFAVAMKAGATKEHFDTTIGIHPTAAEELVTMREKRSDLKE
ncbi:MAG: FAD-dependent oxidoreductase, partial [Nitrospina sp.]|nr:FAD-dependent oxidoreductase [Nitrospina sp.]